MNPPLQPGMTVGTYTLTEHLNDYQSNGIMLPTWKAHDGQDYVLRMELLFNRHGDYWHTASIPYESKTYGIGHLAASKAKQIDPLLALPPIPGLATLLDCGIYEPTDTLSALVICRRYYPQRLTERFPPDADHPPTPALLDAFAVIAQALDTLSAHLPELDFDLSPGDLLMDGDSPVIVDYGLSLFYKLVAFNQRMPFSRIERDRKVPLVASYPNEDDLIGKTDAQYATAALYVYVRSRYMIFEDQADPFMEDDFLPTMMRLKHIYDAVKQYQENGSLNLWMLPDEREKAVVARALAQDAASRYASSVAFVEALRTLSQ